MVTFVLWLEIGCEHVCTTKALFNMYSKTCLKWLLKEDHKKVLKTSNRLMLVKSNAECSVEHSAILLTCIKLHFVPHGFKTFVLSIFEWPLKTGFTVHNVLPGHYTNS